MCSCQICRKYHNLKDLRRAKVCGASDLEVSKIGAWEGNGG